jgi:nucleoside 2-deoxyribosyltransferase
LRRPLVYLAGGIAGLSFDDATDWRSLATGLLRDRGIETLNPMRGKDALASKNAGIISGSFHDYETQGAFFTARGIMTRDFNDVKTCDALLVNLLMPTLARDANNIAKPSLGTVMELGWAYALQKPAIVAIEAHGNPHDNHPMIHEAMRFRVESLEEAIDAVAVVLNR